MRTIPRTLIDNDVYCVNYLVYSNDEGVREFIYVAVRQSDMEGFRRAIRLGNFDAEDYGVVLEHGKGEASDIIKQKMKLMYKCDHVNAMTVADYNP